MLRFPSCPIKYSDLRKKQVINTCDGSCLGNICDLEIDTMCGRINAIMLPQKRKIFSKPTFTTIRWEQIERIGEDTILVKIPTLTLTPK